MLKILTILLLFIASFSQAQTYEANKLRIYPDVNRLEFKTFTDQYYINRFKLHDTVFLTVREAPDTNYQFTLVIGKHIGTSNNLGFLFEDYVYLNRDTGVEGILTFLYGSDTKLLRIAITDMKSLFIFQIKNDFKRNSFP